MTTRRQLLRSVLMGAALAPWARLSVAAPGADAPRFVFVILRGGLDGLTAVPAPGDPAFAEARGALAAFASEPLPLDGRFALHPLLPQLHAAYGRGELAVLHAVGLPYRERSHFDAQQVLESGGVRPHELNTGWLGRALANRGGAPLQAVALETAVPLVLRGPAEVDTWAPSTLPEPTADLVARLEALYRTDPVLAQALARARSLRNEPGMVDGPQDMAGPRRSASVGLAAKAAEFLQRGSQVAVLELSGWDSHANQAAPNGATSGNLRNLDATLADFFDQTLNFKLNPRDTAEFVVATPFEGRFSTPFTVATGPIAAFTAAHDDCTRCAVDRIRVDVRAKEDRRTFQSARHDRRRPPRLSRQNVG